MLLDRKGTSQIIGYCSRSAGSAKRELEPKMARGLLHPCFRAERASSIDTGAYDFQLRIVQSAIDPCDLVTRTLQGPLTQGKLG